MYKGADEDISPDFSPRDNAEQATHEFITFNFERKIPNPTGGSNPQFLLVQRGLKMFFL